MARSRNQSSPLGVVPDLEAADEPPGKVRLKRISGQSRRSRTRAGAPALSETFASLRCYVEMIRARRAVTARDLASQTGIADGTLYPLIQKRIRAGLVDATQRDGVAQFSLTQDGYQRASALLLDINLDLADWMAADRYFGRSHESDSRVTAT